jgi:hypothetical protein
MNENFIIKVYFKRKKIMPIIFFEIYLFFVKNDQFSGKKKETDKQIQFNW